MRNSVWMKGLAYGLVPQVPARLSSYHSAMHPAHQGLLGPLSLPYPVGVSQHLVTHTELLHISIPVAPLHRSLSTPPLLGDTTATQALLFSPPFNPPTLVPPSYPNFTLPNGNVSFPNVAPPPASSQPNASLILTPTSQLQQQFNHLTKSACAIQNAAKSISGSWLGTNGTGGVNGSTSLALRDTDGWRSQWIVEGLTASTNYSVWVVQDGGALAGPIYAFTKSCARVIPRLKYFQLICPTASFACPLVHSLPYCPLTSYAVPFPPTPDGATTYSASNLPSNVSDLLISSLSNFTIALLTFPCGRDVYSPIQTCESCATAYRTWACQVSLPRCGEIPPTLASSLASQPTPSKQSKESNNMPLPTPAILSHPPAQSRLEPAINTYDELLPCIETCHAMDRACPPFLGITCPHTTVNANWSYGVGFIDAWAGTQGEGNPGVAQDQWGVTWCNG